MKALKTCSWLEDGEQCGSLCEGSTDYCATHGYMLRKQKRMAKKVQIVQPVKKVSAKQARDLQDYGIEKRKYLIGHPICELQIPGVCTKIAIDVHHCAKRGVNLLKPDTFKSGCRECHTYIETVMSAEERRERGFLITKHNQTL